MVGSVHSQLRETCEMGKTLAASTPAAEPRKGHFRSLTKAVSRAKNALLGVFKRRECFSPTRKARTDALFYPPVHRRLTVRDRSPSSMSLWSTDSDDSLPCINPPLAGKKRKAEAGDYSSTAGTPRRQPLYAEVPDTPSLRATYTDFSPRFNRPQPRFLSLTPPYTPGSWADNQDLNNNTTMNNTMNTTFNSTFNNTSIANAELLNTSGTLSAPITPTRHRPPTKRRRLAAYLSFCRGNEEEEAKDNSVFDFSIFNTPSFRSIQ